MGVGIPCCEELRYGVDGRGDSGIKDGVNGRGGDDGKIRCDDNIDSGSDCHGEDGVSEDSEARVSGGGESNGNS